MFDFSKFQLFANFKKAKTSKSMLESVPNKVILIYSATQNNNWFEFVLTFAYFSIKVSVTL